MPKSAQDRHPTRRDVLRQGAAAALAPTMGVVGLGRDEYDIVIIGARCIDPETKLDAIRNIGIRGRTIVAVTPKPIRGKKEIDGKGLVASPGFIDPIAHGQDLENDRYQALDGVTTTLQMESGAADQEAWHKKNAGQRLLNYGAGCGHSHARERFLKGEDYNLVVATKPQIRQMADYLDGQLAAGALGMGFGLEYNPASTRWEVAEMFRVAGRYGASTHIHTRYGTLLEEQSNITAIQEVIANGLIHGAPVHIVHVPSMALGNTADALTLIERAQARGLDVTCDFYPYTAFGTGLASEVFAPGWQEKFGMSYGDLEWAETHERLTEQTFNAYREKGGFVIAHCIPEDAVRLCVSKKFVMVGSDGRLRDGVGHPRTSGTFCRVLGRYVREEKLTDLMTALRKMTLMPAKRFEKRCPEFKKKGRLQVGCDADIVLFDAKTISDRSTYANPELTSVGVKSLIVMGSIVVESGKLRDQRTPGVGLRAKRV